MTISSDFIKIINEISNQIELPSIKDIISPQNDQEPNKSNFSAVILEDNTIGLMYINLDPIVKKKFKIEDFTKYRRSELMPLVKLIKSNNLFEKSLGFGCINAVSQFVFKKANFSFDFTSDSLGLLQIKKSDIIGMVGLFPPLVNLIEKIGSKLIIIEKKEELVQNTKSWSVTLDPSKLLKCNKVLITGTTVLNETLDAVLEYCNNAEKASIIGPTASFLPDPIFQRNIDVIGGTCVINHEFLNHAIQRGIRWSDSVRKYTIERKSYQGYEDLLFKILK